MRRRIAIWSCIVLIILLAIGLLTGATGGLAYFYPDTLEYKTQREITVLWGELPIYRSPLRDTDNEMVTYLKQKGFVTPLPPPAHRREPIFHWNYAWKDGYGTLYDPFIRNRRQVIAWSEADPVRAQLYWSEGFKYLRSETESGIGLLILYQGWRCQTIEELRAKIVDVKDYANQGYP